MIDSETCVGCYSCVLACTRRFAEVGFGKSTIHVRSVGGIERGHTVIVCRACEDPPCAKACPEGALKVREGGGVTLDASRCTGWKHCVDACPFGAIFWDEESNKPMICVYCGYCAEYCPYGVITLEEVG